VGEERFSLLPYDDLGLGTSKEVGQENMPSSWGGKTKIELKKVEECDEGHSDSIKAFLYCSQGLRQRW